MKELVVLAKDRPNIAYLYAFIGNIAVAVMQILFKKVSKYISPFQALFYRSFILVLITLMLIRRQNKQLYLNNNAIFRAVIVRIVLMTTSAVLMIFCLRYLPVSTVSTVWNTGPIFIFFIEAFYYRTPMNRNNFLIAMVSFIGVILMVQPEFLFGVISTHKIDNYYFYIFLVILSAFGNALNMHFIHGLAKKIEPLVNIYYSHLGFIALSSMLCVFDPQELKKQNANFNLVALVLGIAMAGFISQTLIFLANSFKKPSLMMPFGYFGVATGFIADVYLFDTQFTFLTVLGIFLTSGGLLSGFLLQKNAEQSAPPTNPEQLVELRKVNQNGDILNGLEESPQSLRKT